MILQRTLIACAILIPHLLSASPQNTASDKKALATFYTVEGSIEKEYNRLVEKKLSAIGFRLTNPYTRVNDQYKNKWGSSVLDVLSYTPVVRDSMILPLLNIDPRIAGFAPFNVLLYKKSNENLSHVGHLTPEVMLDILQIDNDEVRRKFSSPFKALDATIAQELGGDVSTLSYKKLPEKTMINYALEFDTSKDINDFVVEFQKKFKLAFTDSDYLVSDYHNFMDATPDAKTILSNYQAFGAYSLNHLELSYTIFDTQAAKTEAGIFAPFTMYMYIKKETHTVVLGMVRLHNWSNTLGMTDEKHIKIIEQLDSQIPQLLEKMGMHAVENTNPLLSKTNSTIPVTEKSVSPNSNKPKEEQKSEITADRQTTSTIQANTTNKHIQHIRVLNKIVDITIPSVPQVISVAFGDESISTHRGITFSKRVPPNYIPHRFDKARKSQESTIAKIGEVANGKIAAYLRGEFIEVENLKKSLESAGFKVLATAPVNKKEDLISIVFTNDELLSLSDKPIRGFMASLRALVDTKEKTMSITNPLYMAKGFLQGDFDEKTAKKVLVKLVEAFPKLKNSKDSLKFQLLPKYQFMNGMPKYQDMIEVASGSNLLEKIKENKKVVFTQTLSSGATLIGIQLGKRTRKFTKRIGRNNAAMLPYPILIEDGKAKILDPKFYISYMYPMLTMSEFMTIATVPDAMVKDCEKVFK